MAIATIVKSLLASNSELSAEVFGSTTPTPQVVQSHGVIVSHVTDLYGNKVQTSPMLKDLLFEVNGGANIVFGQRWLSVAEMADPFGKDAEFLYVYDPVDSVATSKEPFFRQLEDDVYAFQETCGIDATGKLSEGEYLVLLGYNLIEIGTRPTYLYFSDNAVEPAVWSSAIDWTQIYGDLEKFLESYLV